MLEEVPACQANHRNDVSQHHEWQRNQFNRTRGREFQKKGGRERSEGIKVGGDVGCSVQRRGETD